MSIIYSTRITCNNEITDLTNEFKLDGSRPFSLYIVPISDVASSVINTLSAHGIIIPCKLRNDATSRDRPFNFGHWSESMVQSLDANAIDLTVYRVWWGAGAKADENL